MTRITRATYTVSLLSLALSALGCGGSSPATSNATGPTGAKRAPSRAGAPKPANPSAPAPVLKVRVVSVGVLPAAVQDAASASLPDGRLVLLGGLDPADSSTDAVTVIDGSRATRQATLPVAQHDAQAAVLGQYVYLFGGGQFSTYDHILRFDPARGTSAQVGALPAPASDVAVASNGGTAYIVGGYDGTRALDTILAWRPGAAPRVVGRLPVALRYAAAVFVSGRLIIAGGSTTSGPSSSILSFDPATGRVARIGTLPHPLTHAGAGVLNGTVLIVGGRRQLGGDQTRAVLGFDPTSGAVHLAGRLPAPLSDAAVALSGRQVIVAGGERAGTPVASILALRPA